MMYLELFLGFLKVGLFSFGGAYSAIPLIREVVLSYGWIDDEMLSYMIAVSESTPGPIMINLATYVGSVKGGVLGALLATFAVVLPCFILIILITAAMNTALKNKYVQAALGGLTPCIIGIIGATGATLILNNCFSFSSGFSVDRLSLGITVALAVLYWGSRTVLKKKMSPILLIALSAVVGAVAFGL